MRDSHWRLSAITILFWSHFVIFKVYISASFLMVFIKALTSQSHVVKVSKSPIVQINVSMPIRTKSDESNRYFLHDPTTLRCNVPSRRASHLQEDYVISRVSVSVSREQGPPQSCSLDRRIGIRRPPGVEWWGDVKGEGGSPLNWTRTAAARSSHCGAKSSKSG